MRNSKIYNRQYYRLHRKQLLKNKKAIYKNNPIYRERTLRQAALRQRFMNIASLSYPIVKVNNIIEQTFSLFQISKLKSMPLKYWMLSRMVLMGVIPKALYKNRRRFSNAYCESQMKLIIHVLKYKFKTSELLKTRREILSMFWDKPYKFKEIDKVCRLSMKRGLESEKRSKR